MKKLLLILFLFIGSLSYGQTIFTQTYVDRCTGDVQIVTANFVNGSATVAFYNKVRTFTYQQFVSGELHQWLTETYVWWQSLSPCSETTSQAQQAQQTAQTATAAAQTASTAASSAAAATSSVPTPPTTSTTSTPPPSTDTTQTATSGTTQSTTGGTTDATSSQTNTSNNTSSESTNQTSNTESQNTDTSNTSEPAQGESGTTGSGGESSEPAGGGETSESSGGQTEETSDGGGETSESEGGQTEETSEGSGESESSEESKTEETKEESKEEEVKEESKEEEKKEEESSEEKEEEKKDEESEEKEEESDEEKEEESEDEDSESDEKEEEEKEKKQKKMMPIQLRADMMANQALLGNYDIVTSIGATQSSIYGDESYGATAMIWSNLRQFALNTSYTKVHMTKVDLTSIKHERHSHYKEGNSVSSKDPITPPAPKLSHITSASVGYMNNFGNGTLVANMMKIKPTKYGTFGAGINMANMFGENAYQQTMIGYNVLYTNQVMLSSRINYAPAFIWTQTPFSTKLEWRRDEMGRNHLFAQNQMKGQRIHGMMILANSFTVQLTRRFSFNVGATFIKSTDPNIPLIKSFMIGAKLPF